MVKNLVFYAILLYASVRDHKTHTVPDSVHVLILLAAIPGIRLLSSLLGFFLVPLPFLAAALKNPDSIGGGDIKLMAACGFFLGMEKGIAAAIIGLTLAVLVQGAFLRNRNAPFALIPYLTAGCMAASLIN